MLKMTIDNEEVVSKNNFTIKEEMLSPSSTILNNTYPKTWEDDKNYTSRFYYPKDYAKLDIQNFSITPEEAGTTIDIVGNATLTDVDTTKESRVFSLKGQTSQTGTPTPDSPIPVNVVSGDNYINICGKNLLDIQTNINANTGSGLTLTYNSDGSVSMVGTTTRTYGYITSYYDNYLPIGTYTLSINQALTHRLYMNITYEDDTTANITINAGSTKGTLTTTKAIKKTQIAVSNMTNNTAYNETIFIMLEVGSTSTTYEPYIVHSYPIYLGVENLFNYSYSNLNNINRCTTSQVDNGFTLTSTGASGFGFASLEIDNTLLGKEITISMKSSGKNPSGRLFYHNSSGGLTSTVGNFWTTNNAYTTTLPSSVPSGSTGIALVLYISQTNNTSGEYATFSDIQIELGSKANSYSAYGTTPIELCKIGTYQDKIYKGVGYNLFDGQLEQGSYSSSSEKTSSTTRLRNINTIDVNKATTYTISGNYTGTKQAIVYEYNGETFIQTISSSWTNLPYTFTTSANTTKINFVIRDNGNGTILTTDISNVMLNEGTTALDYEPYNAKDKWLLHKEIGKVVLDGSESGWSTDSSTKLCGLAISDIKSIVSPSVIEAYSNYYKAYSLADSRNNTNGMSSNQSTLWLNNNSQTLANFKTWLNTHNTTVYYVLATPTTTLITDTTLLEQLDDLESQ